MHTERIKPYIFQYTVSMETSKTKQNCFTEMSYIKFIKLTIEIELHCRKYVLWVNEIALIFEDYLTTA